MTILHNKDSISVYGQDYVYFCRTIRDLTEINIEDYKASQMHRRLSSFRNRNKISNFRTYAKLIQEDPEKLNALVNYLTINVTEFFRNPEQWSRLKEGVLPQLNLLAGKDEIKIWSTGCSRGQEPYSLAMVVEDTLPGRCRILATDIDEASLCKAALGRYSKDDVNGVPGHYIDKYFRCQGDTYLISDTLKKLITFERHNLLSHEYPGDIDLIVCRNVLIYLTDKGKERVMRGLVSSLNPGGIMFTGSSEAVLHPKMYGLEQIFPFFYKKDKNS